MTEELAGIRLNSNTIGLIEMRGNRVFTALYMKRQFESTYEEYQTKRYPLEVVEASADDDAIVGF